jgi:hypothetical protein
MGKKSKKRRGKKALPKPIPINLIPITLTDEQVDQAKQSIKDNGFAAFKILEIDSAPDVCTTKTIHR